MNDSSAQSAVQIRCRKCGTAISKPIEQLINGDQLSLEDSRPLMPSGCWLRSELVTSAELFYGVGPCEILVNVFDLVNVAEGGVRNGCCGPNGLDGANLFCQCRTPIGTEHGDCWMPHFVSIP